MYSFGYNFIQSFLYMKGLIQNSPGKLTTSKKLWLCFLKCTTTFMFMTAWAFEARHCPTLLNEIKKTKLDSNTEPQAGINILLCTVPRLHYSLTTRMPRLWMCVGFVRPWHWCGFGGLNYFSLFSVTKHNSLFE
jgi:hypothetical protein